MATTISCVATIMLYSAISMCVHICLNFSFAVVYIYEYRLYKIEQLICAFCCIYAFYFAYLQLFVAFCKFYYALRCICHRQFIGPDIVVACLSYCYWLLCGALCLCVCVCVLYATSTILRHNYKFIVARHNKYSNNNNNYIYTPQNVACNLKQQILL